MARSLRKPPIVQDCITRNIKKKKKVFYTRSRRSFIFPSHVGYVIYVYNGKNFCPVQISTDHIGHKLGEFALTRKFYGHSGAKSKK